MPNAIDTQATEVKKIETDAPVAPKAEDAKIGDVMNDKKPEDKTVGLDKFLELKKENKEMRKSMTEIENRYKKLIEDGVTPTKSEIKDELDDILSEYPDVDPKFIKNFASTMEKRFEQKLRPIEEKDKQSKIDGVFKTHFEKSMENMPEYKDIVNPDVIKVLSLDPKNSDKTFSQLIEETYGRAIGGKRTMETAKPRGGKEPGTVDVEKAKRDPAYFREIMSDPNLKKQYNAKLLERFSS
jgi:hypothetical protein